MQAATLRVRRSSIRLPDAVHIVTAQARSCGLLVSHDRRLSMLDGIRMLAITPFTVDDILGNKPS
jgi:predicted nucleic acid-binding protein